MKAFTITHTLLKTFRDRYAQLHFEGSTTYGRTIHAPSIDQAYGYLLKEAQENSTETERLFINIVSAAECTVRVGCTCEQCSYFKAQSNE